ncbi:uncharacterized protein MYCFIDRAFT_193878 [Pseudocercospora fijiensis CIRAD86]|uniref:Uncharacterized protein n=1 Tax=Pseudocercospora fijiensis (strain CIRAD86) TaxID=383855 RepID=M3ALZ8_PSEFD|nr:uncharacterized protein MYCFIDRAFT_193878 [Pseudocercospora fijiensis CIRAD86]EME85616.1 hypothetical protein MYCFIDRAFT_193878 [Pseudocercospora fijiensis CIRAD86]
MSITHEEAARVRKYLWSYEQVPTVKIAVLGSDGVGKRSILQRGDVCDMSEAELLEYVRPNEACFLVYDVTRRESFDLLDKLRQVYVKRRRIPRRQARSNTVFVIANRIDRWRGDWTVSMHEADAFAQSFGALFLQMSALTGKGTGDEVVVDMLGHILLNRILDEAGPRWLTAPVVIEQEDRRSM